MAFVFLASFPALAEVQVSNEAAQAEAYFQGLKTVKSRFIQTSPDGSQLRGTFYLNRPGKLRFQYDSPSKDFVVADGLFIYFYDGEVKQQSNAPISQTLADFLLRKDLKLSGDLKIIKIMRSGGLLQITMVQRDEPKAGELTLGFTEGAKYQLKKWRVKDSVGNITETELFDMQTGIKLPSSLFAYRDPEVKGLNK
jgi:outer membrane lipoprotein-sorting protein